MWTETLVLVVMDLLDGVVQHFEQKRLEQPMVSAGSPAHAACLRLTNGHRDGIRDSWYVSSNPYSLAHVVPMPVVFDASYTVPIRFAEAGTTSPTVNEGAFPSTAETEATTFIGTPASLFPSRWNSSICVCPQEPVVSLTIETDEAGIAQEYDALRMLTEKIVKRSGYIRVFHKTDTDQWPSAPHAHDYEKNLKLDALTGDIYDAGTRQCCKKLSAKELGRIHDELRQSKDFGPAIADGFIAKFRIRTDRVKGPCRSQ